MLRRRLRSLLAYPAIAAPLLLLGIAGPQSPPQAAAAGEGPTSVRPVPRTEGAVERQGEVLRRVREARGTADLVFVGDSITQGWEGNGRERWETDFAPYGAINLGVSGDRTEHVLWRLREAPLTPLAPKAVVLLIGTNNLGHGSSNAEETLLGIRRVIETLRGQCPDATIVVCGILPRGNRFNAMRGDICQINQVLARLDDARTIVVDFGERFVAIDGSIPVELMPDYLHLSPAGYGVWADAILPVLRPLLPSPSAAPSTRSSTGQNPENR
jgi:lysophospholipase L1-like esterase